MIRRRAIHRQIKERLERDPVIDLAFKLWIGFDLKPFLKQHALEQKQGGISPFTFFGLADVIEFYKHLLYRVPVNCRFNPVEEY